MRLPLAEETAANSAGSERAVIYRERNTRQLDRNLCMANRKLLKDFAIRQAGSCRPSMSRIERASSTIEAAHPAKATGNPECGRLPAAAECADGSPRRRGRTVCRISIALPYARLAALDG
jgi:hypothetical protein